MMVLCMSLVLCTILTLTQAYSFNSSIVPVSHRLCASESHPPELAGAYVPQCDSDGNFLPQQCWASSGYCWCVNVLTGEEIPHTRTPPGTPPVDCGSFSNGEDYNLCPTGWSRYGNRCFIFIDTPKTWADAESYCVFEGGNLASVHSSEEDRFLQRLTRGDTHDFPRTWIGADDSVQGLWLWSDGSRFDYTNWYSGRGGTDSSRDCVVTNIGATLLWHDDRCTNSFGFVCAKEIQTLT